MRYLKPSGQKTSVVKTPLLSDDFSQENPFQWPMKINFPGWRKPQSNWSDWVEKLSVKCAKTWEQTGICDSILSSLCEIRPNPDIILGLCELWCPQTNTFIFPWGEATITLEDVMILAGLPVLGEPVNLPLLGDSMKVLECKLNRVRSDITKCQNAKRASYSAWVKYFNEGGEEIESLQHVGFLAYWLSRFVFPDVNTRAIGKHVFPIAVRLSLGEKVTLAPAVLACLYQNLTFLAHNAADCSPFKREVSVPGPFWIVQIWALERFPLLGLKLAKPLSLGQPRAARWDNLVSKESLTGVRSILRSGESFQWRPYALDLENWRHRSFYPVNELIVSDCSALDDEELKSFWVCLHPQQLVGMDCGEIYRPQRVAMQFGYDQDLPGEFVTFHALEQEKGCMFVSSRFSQPVMSRRYSKWWTESMIDHRDKASKEVEQVRTNIVTTSELNFKCGFVLKGPEQEGSHHNKPILTNVHVKSGSNYEAECLLTGLKEEDDYKKATFSNDLEKFPLNCEGGFLSKELEKGGSDQEKPTVKNELKYSGIISEIEFMSKGVEQEDSDNKNSTLTDDLMKRDSSCEGDCVPNAAETSTPRSNTCDVLKDDRSRERKFCAGEKVWSSKSTLFVDLDNEEVVRFGEKYSDQSSDSTKEVKRRVGGTADNPLYISDQGRQVSKKARKGGICFQNPIDVENYFF